MLEEIASASRKQSIGIRQIGDCLSQVDQVTQATTAEAEESAAASEELAGQAEYLREIVTRFRLGREHGFGPREAILDVVEESEHTSMRSRNHIAMSTRSTS
ncbi:MAG: hypothetical protein ACOCW3_05015 [Spirochaetota bacterium]